MRFLNRCLRNNHPLRSKSAADASRDLLRFSLLSTALLLSACEHTPTSQTPSASSTDAASATARYPTEVDGAPDIKLDPDTLVDASPRYLPRSRYGNHSPYTVFGKQYEVMEHDQALVQEGIASWYGTKFHGKRTSSWEPYDMFAMTAAHRELPLPTFVRVTNLSNQRSALVKVNDRGPFHSKRIIDLSYAAAVKLGFAEQGTARVRIEAIPMATLHPVVANRATQAHSDSDSDLENSDSTEKRQTDVKGAHGKGAHALQYAKQQQTSNTRTAKEGSLSDEKLYIQVGAFSDLHRAKEMQKALSEWVTFPITILRPQYQESYHRVRIGPLRNSVQAKAINQLLAKEFNINTPLLVWY